MFVKPRKSAEGGLAHLAARLRGVRGFTGRGVVRCTVRPNGESCFTITLKGVAGVVADIHVGGARFCSVALNNGSAKETRVIPRNAPAPEAGAQIEIRQNGAPILIGALAGAESFRLLRRTRKRVWIVWKISWRARRQFLRIFDQPP